MKDVYGLHLLMRVSKVANRAALADGDTISRFLVDLVNALGMNVLAGPMVTQEVGEPQRAGFSGVIILYESHAAIHTYSNLGEAFIDVFSCKVFAVDIVAETMTQYYGQYDVIEQTMLSRGIHWGTDIEREMKQWEGKHPISATSFDHTSEAVASISR